MKVLFAIGDASLSGTLVDYYSSMFGEQLEYKDVFGFDAILDEIKQDNSYDRIIISEVLEPFQSEELTGLDNFLFGKMDKIASEAGNAVIIFIGSERRAKSDSLSEQFYEIGVYNILTGDDRQIPNLCRLIKEPRSRKEAREELWGKINPDEEFPSNDGSVSEAELFRISTYFGELKSTQEYIEAFSSMTEQYDDKALVTIVVYLSTNLPRGDEIYNALDNDPRFQKYCTWRTDKPKKDDDDGKHKGLFGLFNFFKD